MVLLKLEYLSEIKVPRSLRDHKVEKSSSIHTFLGASNDAISYLRCEYYQGYYSVSVTVSKTKVVHLKPITTPRLELMAAILVLNVTMSVIKALSIPIADAHF